MELPTVAIESHASLRSLSNAFFKNYRSLESLGENVSEWNTILIYILVSKLDQKTKREWEVFSKNVNSPKIQEFNEFLNERCQILETLDTKTSLTTIEKKTSNLKSFVTSEETTYRPKCSNCKEQHLIYFCDNFKKLSVADRLEKVKRLNLCTNCLWCGHRTSECRSTGCKICRKRHSTLLHRSTNVNTTLKNEISNNSQSPTSSQAVLEVPNNNTNDSVQEHTTLSNTCQGINSFILLSTAIIDVYDRDKNIVPCRVLLDSASQSNFVSAAMLNKLKLPTTKIDLPVVGINKTKSVISRRVEISLKSQHSGYKTKLNFLVLPTITDLSPQKPFDILKLNIPQDLILADSNLNVPDDIDMLIGSEVFYDFLCIGQIKLGKNLPTLQKTLLGWVVGGSVPCGQNKRAGKSDVMLSNCFFSQDILNKNLEKFWLVEEVDPNPHAVMTKEEIECGNHFQRNTTRDETDRFVVKLPLKNNYKELGDSEQFALNRLYSIERRLAKNPELEKSYKAFMQEYQNLGHMTKISQDLPSKTPIYYIPHHCVEKPDSSTTKLRVVFDAACKSSTNLSLNNVLKIGPTIQSDLFSILLRFRKHNFVLIGDLTKMYRQVLINKDERNLQRIVWRNSPDENVQRFQLNTVTYGMASASFLSTRCLLQISQDIAKEFPVESEIIASDLYVDDLLTGSSNLESLILLRRSISNILSQYSFELQKFQSNSHKILDDIIQNSKESNRYSISNDSSVKTLGVYWIPSLYKFEYNCHNMGTEDDKVTKRSILSFVAKIFDPLGILGPLSIRAKLIIQAFWQLQLDWDESIPHQFHSEWLDLKNDLLQVGLVQVPRHVMVTQPDIIEIHGFADASERAYACCVYIRSISLTDKATKSCLLCAKSRVSSLNSHSLPRLELLGALLLARLMQKCIDVLKLKFDKVFLWTDSTIVLSWISNEPRSWKTFVANRVAEIQRLSKIEDWNYVSSEMNPADIISRGANVKDLINSTLWLRGPDFLTDTDSKFKHIQFRAINQRHS